MDDTDVRICMLLLQNSRMPYREIAEKLELSINAVFKRIQKLIDTNVIRGFITNLSLSYLGVLNVIVFGKSDSHDLQLVRKKLDEEENTYWMSIAGGNELYIGGYLKKFSELETYSQKIQDIAILTNPTVGIISHDSGQISASDGRKELDTTDKRILSSLHKDSRKSLSDVASELNLSAKTVRRRIEQLESDGDITHSIQWYPEASNDIISVFHLNLHPSSNKGEVGLRIISTNFPNALFFWSFANLPNYLTILSWNETMRNVMDLQKRLEADSSVESVITNVIYSGFIFDTWREAILN